MNKITNILILMLFILIINVFAQQNSEWTRIESENKEISLSFPAGFSYFFDKQGFSQSNPKNWTEQWEYKNLRSITAHQNGATIFFESYDVKGGKKALQNFLYNYPKSQFRNTSFENFSVLQIVPDQSIYISFFYFTTDKNTYLIGFAAREKTNLTVDKFLKSVKINGKSVFDQSNSQSSEKAQTILITDLSETPIEIDYELTNEKEEKKKKANRKQEDIKLPEVKNVDSDNSNRFIVLFKPRSMYTDKARQSHEQGIVRLRTAFSASGQISQITVIKDLRYGLTENAIKALKRLRFLPAEKNNIPEVAVKTVEYSFTIY
jgi:hypothetical protein